MERPTRTLLVIDDSSVDREIYARFLARDPRHHYEILEAETGREGLDLLAERPVDCVVLDYNLPDTDGLDILDELRASNREQVPVVMLTGAGSEAIAVETMKRGCQDYVVKSAASADGLLQAVENAIEKVTLRREIERKRADLEASQREQIELRNRFLSHVSHELRTPLTAVHQFLSLCLDDLAGALTAQQREYLEIAQRNTNQLKKMIGDLMEVTRAEAGKLRVELAPVGLQDLAEESVRTLHSAAASKQIELRAEPAPSLPDVLADESRIRQILGNLIENAIKFTPPGGSITVSAVHDRADPDFVRISVRDTGCGISKEGQQKIFDSLHQEHLESRETRKGLGLGLAICKELLCLQRGRIWVESEEGAGSSFHFTLPVFSLARIVEPALVQENRLRGSYTVVRVEVTSRTPAGSLRIGEEQSRSVGRLLAKLVYYPFDVVMPRLWRTEGADVHFVVAATGSDGMQALVPRLRSHLEAHVASKVPGGEVRVDGRVEEIDGRACAGPLDETVEHVARRIEAMLRDPREWSK